MDIGHRNCSAEFRALRGTLVAQLSGAHGLQRSSLLVSVVGAVVVNPVHARKDTMKPTAPGVCV
jgi:hypothetical protein